MKFRIFGYNFRIYRRSDWQPCFYFYQNKFGCHIRFFLALDVFYPYEKP